jgi:SAM-dependent methyltransferase
MIQERNDALKDNNKGPVRRYEFAAKCLSGPLRTMVDAACGMGYGSKILGEFGHRILGLDKSPEAIKYAEENYGKPGISFYVCDLEAEPLPQCDAVVCLETLCHLKDPQKFIDGLPGKELVISAPVNPNPNDGYFYRLHHLSPERFREMLHDWEIIDEYFQGNLASKYLTIYAKRI